MLPDLVLAGIREHRPSGSVRILLACSGGLDSQVLLHAAASVWPAADCHVGHVHHGLQPEADDWLAFTETAARQLGLAFLWRRLPAVPSRPGSGIEAWARRLRYQALAEMAADAGASLVLTAHHANDQLETHRLRSQRGAGVLGLGAMRMGAPLPGAPHCLLLRPFLGVERRHVLQYALTHGLEWVEDPSNQDLRYTRNRIRRDIERSLLQDPEIIARGLVEIGGYQQAADRVRRQALEDLAAARLLLAPHRQPSLSRAALARLPPERAAEALRCWLQEAGVRMPTRAKLGEILRQLVLAGSSHARLWHDGKWLLRYRDRIDVADALPAAVAPTVFRWRGESLMSVAGQQYLFRRLAGQPRPSAGADAGWLAQAELLLDRGRGSDRLRLAEDGPSRSWKNLVQEHGVPPWLRSALPVLRHGEHVLHAAPFGINRDLAGATAGDQIAIEWQAPKEWMRWL